MRDESSRLQRVLLGTSVALFAGLLGWILVSHALAPEELAVVEIPASWEPPRSSPSPDWDDPETAAVGGGRGEPRRHFNRGTALLRQDRTEEAVAAFEQALALHPHYGEARYNLALALGRLGRVDAAIEAYRRVVEADRSAWSAKSHYNLALLLSGQDRLREARAALDAALRLRPDFVKARYNRALLLARMELTSEALDDYRKLLDLEPDHARARLKLGALLLREGDLEAAREHLERAVADEPGSERAHHKLGLCLMKLGENELAAAALGRAVEIDPEYVEAHYNRGLARQRTKDLAGAAQSFRRAVALRGDRADYRYRLGVALARSGDAEAAIEQYQEALLLRPGYFHALHALGLAHYRSGDYEPALQSFLEANSARPESYDAAYNLGLTLLKLGRPAEAEERFRQTLALEETTEARYNHGSRWRARGGCETPWPRIALPCASIRSTRGRSNASRSRTSSWEPTKRRSRGSRCSRLSSPTIPPPTTRGCASTGRTGSRWPCASSPSPRGARPRFGARACSCRGVRWRSSATPTPHARRWRRRWPSSPAIPPWSASSRAFASEARRPTRPRRRPEAGSAPAGSRQGALQSSRNPSSMRFGSMGKAAVFVSSMPSSFMTSRGSTSSESSATALSTRFCISWA